MLFDNDFNNFFESMWNNFNRPVKDMRPVSMKRDGDKGYIVTVNTLGIDKNDIRVSFEKEKGRPYPILKVEGQTKLDKIDFENKVNIGATLKIDEEIESVNYECKNGLTIVYIKIKQAKVKRLEAKSIENGDEFDW